MACLEKVYRVSVVAVVLQKEKKGNSTSFLVDDGTGQLIVRFFEPAPVVNLLGPGDAILIVARPRKYNQETYLSPDIVKKVDPSWLKVRKNELQEGNRVNLPEAGPDNEENMEERERNSEPAILFQKVLQFIKKMDSGSGVRVEELIELSPVPETERLLERLLEKGEIFQNSPGKVKAL